MTRIVVVPNNLRDAINAKLDAAIAECPLAEPEREFLYGILVGYYDEHGTLPEFTLEERAHGSQKEEGK